MDGGGGESGTLPHPPGRPARGRAADDVRFGELGGEDVQHHPLDQGLASAGAARDDTDGRGECGLNRVPLLLGQANPHLRLLPVDLLVQIAHVGQPDIREHGPDPDRHILFRFGCQGAIDVVLVEDQAAGL